MEVGAWVYDNFDEVSGVSFLPYDGGTYAQAPYQEIDADKYSQAKAMMPKAIDWTRFQSMRKKTQHQVDASWHVLLAFVRWLT